MWINILMLPYLSIWDCRQTIPLLNKNSTTGTHSKVSTIFSGMSHPLHPNHRLEKNTLGNIKVLALTDNEKSGGIHFLRGSG